MAVPKASIAVTQFNNGKFDIRQPEDQSENARYMYRVERAVNTLDFKIDLYLTPAVVQAAIDKGVQVTVGEPKR